MRQTLFQLVLVSFLTSCEGNIIVHSAANSLNVPTPDPIHFEATIIGMNNPTVLVPATHGDCTISGDLTKLIYEKTDEGYTGPDSCIIIFGSGCTGTFEIDFSEADPKFIHTSAAC